MEEKPRLTWAEFKELIDAALKEQGISEDSPIYLIEIYRPGADDFGAERVSFDEDGIEIS